MDAPPRISTCAFGGAEPLMKSAFSSVLFGNASSVTAGEQAESKSKSAATLCMVNNLATNCVL